MNHPIHRTFENHNVRLVLINGAPWFIANDVSAALLYSEASAMTRHLDDDEKGLSNVQTLGGEQEMLIISESGLFSAMLRSRKPEAKRFKKWVTGEVLPSLRKYGSYSISTAPEAQAPAPMSEHIEADRVVSAGRVFNTMFRTGRSIGMNRRMAASRANQATQRFTGIDLIGEMGASNWIDDADTPTPQRRNYQLQQQLRQHLTDLDWPQIVTGPNVIEGLGITHERANQMAVGQCLALLGYRRVRLNSTGNGTRPWAYALQHGAVIGELSA